MAAQVTLHDEEYFWEKNPSSLVNARVAVTKDKSTQLKEGSVTKWNPKVSIRSSDLKYIYHSQYRCFQLQDGMHLVRYDDRSSKWHHLKVTPFWVLGKKSRTKFSPRPGAVKARYGPGYAPLTSTSAPHAAATSTRATSFSQLTSANTGVKSAFQLPSWTMLPKPPKQNLQMPYKSPNPNAHTDCTFYVVLDPQALQGGEHVAVTGNLSVIGAWSHGGVPMSRHPHNPFLWSITVILPYTTYDVCERGLFQFTYKIVTNRSEEVCEGGECEGEEHVNALITCFRIFFRAS